MDALIDNSRTASFVATSDSSDMFIPTIKKAIICGRVFYKRIWKGKYIDIVPAYENMQSIVKFYKKAGFKDEEITLLWDPTKDDIDD
jgi:hypothetical protein